MTKHLFSFALLKYKMFVFNMYFSFFAFLLEKDLFLTI